MNGWIWWGRPWCTGCYEANSKKWVEHQVLGNNGSVHYFDPSKPLVNAKICCWSQFSNRFHKHKLELHLTSLKKTWSHWPGDLTWESQDIVKTQPGAQRWPGIPWTMRHNKEFWKLTKDGERFTSFSTRKARFPPSKRAYGRWSWSQCTRDSQTWVLLRVWVNVSNRRYFPL